LIKLLSLVASHPLLAGDIGIIGEPPEIDGPNGLPRTLLGSRFIPEPLEALEDV
jgi:hypothetical protein